MEKKRGEHASQYRVITGGRWTVCITFLLIVIIGVQTDREVGETEAVCKSCELFLLGRSFVIQEGDENYYKDVLKLELLLNEVCESLQFQYDYEMCVKEAKGYITGLEKQSPDHGLTLTSTEMCERISACEIECCIDKLPQQRHIAFTNDSSQVIVMWVSKVNSSTAMVKYYESSSKHTSEKEVSAEQSTYTVGGWKGFIYTAVLTDLLPLTEYTYEVFTTEDDRHLFLDPFDFISAPLNNVSISDSPTKYIRRNLVEIGDRIKFNQPVVDAKENNMVDVDNKKLIIQGTPVIAFYGDMSTNIPSRETERSLTTLAANFSINLVIHNGDISYADSTERIWDEYFRMIEGYAGHVAYMTSVGNHENYYNFTAYYSRLTMPYLQCDSTSKQYYSFNYQNIHFISWSFEEYYGLDLFPGKEQYDWLINDLTEANKHRDQQPWVVLMGHRPLYCSSTSNNCIQAYYMRYLLENITNEYHVDVVLQAHDHNYERTYQVYKNQLVSTSYVDPTTPIYFVVGTGGRGNNTDWIDPAPEWSAAHVNQYGYMLIQAPDEYTMDFVFINKDYEVYDNCSITRTKSFR